MASVTPKGALSFKTTSVDDPHFYAQSKTSTKHQAPSKPYRAANEDRDPEHVNDVVKIRFEDIFAEPEGTYSFGTIWGASFKLFTDSKVWCYKFLSALCGVPCGIFWGCHFACLSFCQIWWCEPSLRSISILMRPCARLCGIFLKSFVEPLHYAVGKVFSSIRLTMTKE
ncbi:caveolin-3-like [Dreissena polymorpha]|uniref:Caveolin n=1 Tax=Dreissena polymorpha TaxID=45954 RepID=A0A9D4NF35_DREPO|nr:caveolin-3-like [Dreissena polymorpha]KAH3892474.1 hypothetical protein DPMN_016592 [Dreissena polymorpha]